VIEPATVLRTLLGVGVLVAVALAVLAAVRAPRPVAPLTAVLRGLVQLAVLSVVLTGVITSPVWVAVALVVMLGVAVATSTGRLGWSARRLGVVALAIASGAGTALAAVFATGALELTPRYALAIGGIVIGNAMTIATIAGRRLREATRDRWDEVEGWLALGATPRQATADPARQAISSAIIPTIDQTRTTGIVTLPGAFVGAVFGGVSPIEAGRFQIVVLAAILAAGAVTAAILVEMLAPVATRPDAPGE
jgi:putative ABC transport system permease protein